MASGNQNNSLKLDGKALSDFTKLLATSDVSAVVRNATVEFVRSLKMEVGMPPMEINQLVPIVEECFGEEEAILESFKRGVKKVLNKVAKRLGTNPLLVSRFDGRDIEMLLSDESQFHKAFVEALKSVPRNKIVETNLDVSKDSLRNVIYAVAPAHALPEIGRAPQMQAIMANLDKIIIGDDFETKEWEVKSFKIKIKRILEGIARDLKNEPITLMIQI